MKFDELIRHVVEINTQAQISVARTISDGLLMRNWLIGACIHEFELRGEDRANYGEALFARIAKQLTAQGVPNCGKSRLYRYRDFYRLYPQIVATVPPLFNKLLFDNELSVDSEKVATVSPLSGRQILEQLSYSHIELLVEIDDSFKRAFYEVECIKGNWSVRELRRQIASLYFERSGLSRDKAKLAEMANTAATQAEPRHIIRDPYVFEFLGLRPSEVLPESALEAALLEKIQTFLMELGNGFCFEARQKRLIIGGEYFFVDLVFYHRVLKCHVLVELKVGAFSHEHLGQLNTYVSYYRAHEMTSGDQPPIGILLCTDKNQALVEYALAAIDNRLFVSKYQLELPHPETLQRYLDEQRKSLEAEA